ncbi:M23 family metallopeptidase [Vibrio paucivorans]|uniref:M23 family metallopeptidase n=1 Tax=Vibrio paucivorans TaxID=2829489 RepID=A0A9X3HSQ9_9VIBR|nr:M23 family metallopeptidase [Vibrio paucivorans]MCW8335200.1 M23 family metallopeptidase [Vibrio paucivorans]
MSQKITISVPTNNGEQLFFVGKKTLISSLLLCITAVSATTGYLVMQLKQQTQLQTQIVHAMAQLEQSEQERTQFEALSNEQVDTIHSLSQELEQKRDQIQILGKRVFDVESVLGLANDELLLEGSNLEERIDAAAIDSAVRATMFRLIPNASPVEYQRISSSYGRRTNPITGRRHTHTGIDLTCKPGQPVIAPADGVIETVRPSSKGFGNFLTVRHSFGFMTSYAHLTSFKVRGGQFVSKGDVIATCGNSGNSTGPHLHYEVRFVGRSLNPQYTMDWTPENFDYLFEKENKVKWAPLVKLIDDVVRLQVNLTNNPYVDRSIDTVSNEISAEVSTATVN